MGSRARLTQERSRIRRDELLSAAIQLFAEGGSRAITHRAVTARAGLPPATTTYYFESIDELIRDAIGAHIAQWRSTLEPLTEADTDAEVGIDDATAFIRAVFAARGPDAAALELSIYLAATRDDRLRDAATDALRSLETLAVRMLGRTGVTGAAELAAAAVALIVGSAFRRQSGLCSDETEARLLAGAIRGLVAAHLIGPDGVDRALSTLRPS